MTEQVPPTGLDEPDTHQSTTTGVPAVDQVLADVDRLDDLPLEEHLGAFERAHESLRSALDAQPDPVPSEHAGDSA